MINSTARMRREAQKVWIYTPILCQLCGLGVGVENEFRQGEPSMESCTTSRRPENP